MSEEQGGSHANSGRWPNEGLTKSICRAQLGQPISHEGLTIYPLFTPDGHEPKYELLEDALKHETAIVTEASTGGSVPELLIENRGDKPILILEGDVLIGAKQNRVVNVTVLVPAMIKFTLPVSCVERGRWRYVSPHFSIKRSAHPDLRKSKIGSVLMSKKRSGERMSDQLEVWDKVDSCLHELAADSPTDSLEDGYAAHEKRLSECREKFSLTDGATGFLVAVGGKVVGMDLFGQARTAARCWRRLSESYFIEALRGSREKKPSLPIDAQGFLNDVGQAARLCDNAAGLGCEIEVESQHLAGMGLSWEDRLIHLAAFKLD